MQIKQNSLKNSNIFFIFSKFFHLLFIINEISILSNHDTKSLKNSRSIDLDSAAAIENDETMIINSDHSIITTPVGTPMTDVLVDHVDKSSSTGKAKSMNLLQVETDETSTSDASSCEAPIIGEKGKRHRTKARSDSNRSEKYEKVSKSSLFPVSLFGSRSNEIFVFVPFLN